jgi:hypothetical protein
MRNNIILGGIGIVVLAQLSMHFEVTHTDPIFWYVYAPLAVALGLFINHSAGRGKV